MWHFKRKKNNQEHQHIGFRCPYCGSTNTRLIIYHGTGHANYARIWRGQRSLTYRCLDCGLDFYGEEPHGGITEELIAKDDVIDDEEALHAAEEEIRRQVEEDDDRRCR